MFTETKLLFLHTEGKQPVFAEFLPILIPFKIRTGFTEKFQLHLFKFTGTESKIAGGNFITEGFSDLADSERNFLSGSTLNIFKVDKNTLRSFRS